MSPNCSQIITGDIGRLRTLGTGKGLPPKLLVTLLLSLSVALILTACSDLRAQTPSTDSLTPEQLTPPLRSCEEVVDGTRRYLATQDYSPRQRPVRAPVVYAVSFTQNVSNAERSTELYLTVSLDKVRTAHESWLLEYVVPCMAPDGVILWVHMYRGESYSKIYDYRS